MRASWKTGISFGLTSGVITTLGLIVGLHSGTHSRAIVISGILTIAIADAMSDALGIHVSEEAKNSGPTRHVWEATLATFASKFVIAATFLLPVTVGTLDQAIVLSVAWGLLLLTILSFYVARAQAIAPWQVISEHLFIALFVVVITYVIGAWAKGFVTSG